MIPEISCNRNDLEYRCNRNQEKKQPKNKMCPELPGFIYADSYNDQKEGSKKI